MDKRKVFIVSKGGFDYSDAEKYGELIFLSDSIIDKTKANKLFMQFREKLVNSSKYDYLIITGLPIMVCIASSILARKHGQVNYLIFSDGLYLERNIVYKA